ncbi:MAG: rod shape-determining protein MreD [Spirochaetales bacterium]
MIRAGLWAILILAVLLLLQTTLMNLVVVAGVKPDILLIVFVVLASQNGGLVSQLVGFVLGLAIDIVTTAPLGYNAFQFALAGYLFGLGRGKVYYDPFIVPALMAVLATVYSSICGYLVSQVFQLGFPFQMYFQIGFVVQLLVNLVAAPVTFFLFNFLKQRFQDPRRGFDG